MITGFTPIEVRKARVKKRDKLMEAQVRKLTDELYEANKTIVELHDTIEAYENLIHEYKLKLYDIENYLSELHDGGYN